MEYKNLPMLLLILSITRCLISVESALISEQSMYQKNLVSNSTDDDEPPPHKKVAEMARYIMHTSDWASMATISVRDPTVGQPFSNVWSVSDGPEQQSSGVPYLYLTDMEMSVQDLAVNPHASLSMTLAQSGYCKEQNYDPQSPLCARLILNGNVVTVKPGSKEEKFAKVALFSRHPEMVEWPEDHGFYVGKLNVSTVCVLDFFGGAKFVSVEDYFKVKI